MTYDEWFESLSRFRGNPDYQYAFIRRSLRNKNMMEIFGRLFFPRWIDPNQGTPEMHKELIWFFASKESGAAIEPRGFSKTTWEKIDVMHDIVYDIDPLQVFYGATQTDIENVMDDVRGELEDNHMLRTVYGDLVPPTDEPRRKWNSKRLRITRPDNSGGPSDRKHFDLVSRVAGKGRGININGRRPIKVRIDDGETDEMVRSEKRRATYWRWITEVIEPGLDPHGGTLKMLGTVLHPKCAVLRFYDERGGIRRSAIEHGRSIWPERFPLEWMHRKRDGYVRPDGKRVRGIGRRAFAQEYLNAPLAEGLAMFPQELLDRHTFTPATTPPMREFSRIVFAVDPAGGEGKTADDYGGCVLGLHRPTGRRYVLWSGTFHGGVGTCFRNEDGTWTYTKAHKWFHDVYVRWNPEIAGIEAEQTVQAFWQLIRDTGQYRVRKLRASLGIGRAQASKVDRAKLVEPLVEQGMILFDPGQTVLYDQLVSFPSDDVPDDCADAFFHANSMLDAGGATLDPGDDGPRRIPGTERISGRKY